MRGSESECPVCRRTDIQAKTIASAVDAADRANRSHSDSAIFFDCPACGEFVVTELDCVNLKSPRSQWTPSQLCALLREQTIRRLPRFWLRDGMEPYGPLEPSENLAPIDVNELLGRWPQTVSERLDRVLCNFARMSPSGGHVVTLARDTSALGIQFAATLEEGFYHVSALTALGRLEKVAGSSSGDRFRVAPAGWDRFDEITRGSSSPQNPVFVAMWFGAKEKQEPTDITTQEMTRIYMEGIKPAVERAGYRVSRVDLEEFNDCIMDRVFGDIRAAPFVVADFTGHRHGVYLEAGFGRGLGRPVIQTCATSHFGKAHFDIKHLNHICWKDASDLQEQLFQRIRGSIGQGPHPVPKSLGC